MEGQYKYYISTYFKIFIYGILMLRMGLCNCLARLKDLKGDGAFCVAYTSSISVDMNFKHMDKRI